MNRRRFVAQRVGITVDELAHRHNLVMTRHMAEIVKEALWAADKLASGPYASLFALTHPLVGDEKVLVLKLLCGKSVKEILVAHKNKLPWPQARALMAGALSRMGSSADAQQTKLLDGLLRDVGPAS